MSLIHTCYAVRIVLQSAAAAGVEGRSFVDSDWPQVEVVGELSLAPRLLAVALCAWWEALDWYRVWITGVARVTAPELADAVSRDLRALHGCFWLSRLSLSMTVFARHVVVE